jgi:F-type H+-transporting ATPase subunit b
MLMDWFTVAAQIVNFLILVWLLKHFLYGRILRAIAVREDKIAAGLADAEAKQKEAAAQLALYQAKLQDLEQQQERLLAEARLDADKQRAELIEKAREHAASLESEWDEDLTRERDAFLLDLRRRAATEILALARRAVADLACVDLQQCAVRVFLEKVRDLDREACQKLGKGDLLIRTAIDLPEETRASIQETLHARMERPVILRYERAPGIGLGIELRGNGWRIGWNSESYLESLDEDLRNAIDRARAAHEEPPVAAAAHAGSSR